MLQKDKIFESFVIGGDKEQFGDILNDEIFSENPDGTGNIGHFSNFSNYKISHINIVTNKGYITIKENGKSLKEIQDELGDSTRIIDYSIHFANPENNGGYGFVTKSQIEGEGYKIKFISSDGNYPNTELRENIEYYIWIDDYNFIYSIKNKGIYLYNLAYRKYIKLVEGTDEEFKIKEYKDNVLIYDEKSIKLK